MCIERGVELPAIMFDRVHYGESACHADCDADCDAFDDQQDHTDLPTFFDVDATWSAPRYAFYIQAERHAMI